jgi:hypothetical protein
MATNGNVNHHDQYAASTHTSEAQASVDSSSTSLGTDEIGWYFVEQYYTTVSKTPDRLHVSFRHNPLHRKGKKRGKADPDPLWQLFYGKKAQFVCGREAEVVPVAVGRHVS